MKDRIRGSKVNPKGSASSEKSASKIKLDDKIISALNLKLKEFKETHSTDKVSLNDLKAVYRRGLGAYSSSHRPTISGGKPNTRNAWAMARVNKFLEKASGKKVKKAYVQDDDLLKYADGGEIIPQQGTLYTKSKKSKLEYYKKGNDYAFRVYDVENNPVEKYTRSQYKKRNDNEAIMNYNQFINYLYAENYIDDKYADGGKVGQDIKCRRCGWHWNSKDSEEFDKYVCHKCGFDNTTYYDKDVLAYNGGGALKSFYDWYVDWYKSVSDKINIIISLPNEISGLKSVPYKEDNVVILDLFEKTDNVIDAKPYLKKIIDKADEYGVTIYLFPEARHKYITDEAYKKKITRNYLIDYYKKFGFELTSDKEFMKRLPRYKDGGLVKGRLYAIRGKFNNRNRFIEEVTYLKGNEKSVSFSKLSNDGKVFEIIVATPKEIKNMRIDIWSGMFISNMAMFFIIAVCSATLFSNGVTNIGTAADAAAALRPFAGDFAYMLFTIGIIGVDAGGAS